MQYSKNILSKMNELLMINDESVKIYTEVQNNLTDQDLKIFFGERAAERQRFIFDLTLELKKLGGEPKYSGKLSYNYRKTWGKFRELLVDENESDLLEAISDLKTFDLEKYNELLREINVPLSTCRLLLKQTDYIQGALNAIKRHDLLVA